jgi:hypothetical protein
VISVPLNTNPGRKPSGSYPDFRNCFTIRRPATTDPRDEILKATPPAAGEESWWRRGPPGRTPLTRPPPPHNGNGFHRFVPLVAGWHSDSPTGRKRSEARSKSLVSELPAGKPASQSAEPHINWKCPWMFCRLVPIAAPGFG